ncbi:efflux RND transporter permease subunit [Capnocytophaga catalasegens]|uniref:Glycerol acyltransferase n=1 Tax=Capnocytophaga catalasegens TaxID=1004260 RepID=A0AAV5B0K8_9FLAO|nr:efflux RND transporter permease subunit [Capnocytophaga catalasegens]GIZ14381.1 glycerol acyltransferase [Capnocytophaga catalasegens]GJM51501.1 glycerol acyltransferase [Capnocytophaga catalasegens]GJM53405.1 glycerol acyltransferase [Capnocytophaga catalasegens]
MFLKVYHFVSKYKWLSIIVLTLWIVMAIFAFGQIRFEEDITQVIPKHEKSDITTKVLKQVNFSDKISVIIEKQTAGTLTQMQQYADELCDSLKHSPYVAQIQGVVSEQEKLQTWQFVNKHLPLFLNEPDYQKIEQRLTTDSLQTMVEAHYKTLLSPAGIVARDFIRKDPLGLTFEGLKKLQQLNLGTDLNLSNGYVVTADQSCLLLFIKPTYSGTDTEHNTHFAEKINQLQKHLDQKYENQVSSTFFGAPLVAVNNAQQIKNDILTTVLVSLSVLYLLLVFFYRNFYVPFVIFIPAGLGVSVAFVVLFLLKGTISAISVSIGAVLLGVTIDYSLHILTHYKVVSSPESLYRSVVTPVMLSSLTTAISFFCLIFVHSQVLKDLGIFAFVSILISTVLALILIPHLYPKKEHISRRKTFLDNIGAYPFHQNKWLVSGCLLLIIASFFGFRNIRFNKDLSALNYMPENYKQAQQKLESLTHLQTKSLYMVSYGTTWDSVLQENYKLHQTLSQWKQNGDIQQFSSLAEIVLSEQEQQKRIARWNQFWDEQNKTFVQNHLIEYGKKVGFAPHTYQDFFDLISTKYSPISMDEYVKIKAIPWDDFISNKNGFYTMVSIVKTDEASQASLAEKTPSNTILIDRKHLNETFLGKLKDDFSGLITYSFIAIFVILFLFFKRIELVILTMLPIIVTGIVTSALMNWLHIEFNIFSMIVCTLVLGHAVDFSIFMTCALQKQYTTGKNELPVYKVSVLLASITTILAIGVLIFAKHPALQSVAWVSLIGICTALLITFIFYPTLFRWFIFKRPLSGKSPITLRLLLQAIISIGYYVIGVILLSNIILLFHKFSRKNMWIRKIAASFLISVLYSAPFIRKRVCCYDKTILKKPSMLIANHTSWLDTLTISMLTYRIIYLVNDWVYKSPIFGNYVKKMGFYPVSQGVGEATETLKQKVQEGFSLMIFPEGSRSQTNHIKRFHKGAFFLAEHYGLDIIPLYIHGNSEVQPKGDFIIYDGAITLTMGKPIASNDARFGTNYTERTKRINQYVREEFTKIRMSLEDANYFRKKLFLNYLYKENAIVSFVKKDFEQNKEIYHKLNQEISPNARILRFADDYGQLDFLLAISDSQRKITTIITDDTKRAIAEQSYITKIRTITYLSTPPTENFDVIIYPDFTIEKIIYN